MDSENVNMRVLVSAYACGPGMGSEPGAGWALVNAAAQKADVWLLTRRRFEPQIRAYLDDDPDLAQRLHPIYVDLAHWLLKYKRHHRDVYWYYPLWQRMVGKRAAVLHRKIKFDVVHHATFATDWMPCGLVAMAREVPLVWGPVGGATYVPSGMFRWLGAKGAAHEMARIVVTRLFRLIYAEPVARRSALIVALNSDVMKRFVGRSQICIEPNAVAEPFQELARASAGGPIDEYKTAIFVGRLVAWKGVRLALEALRRPEASRWRLEFIGEGEEKAWLQRAAARHGLEKRVVFRGQLTREDATKAMMRADAMVFPSLHDSAGWVVAEATAIGLPVVCLGIGGPPELVMDNGHIVAAGGSVVAEIAQHLLSIEGEARPAPSSRWSAERLPGQVHDWYQQAIQNGPRDSKWMSPGTGGLRRRSSYTNPGTGGNDSAKATHWLRIQRATTYP